MDSLREHFKEDHEEMRDEFYAPTEEHLVWLHVDLHFREKLSLGREKVEEGVNHYHALGHNPFPPGWATGAGVVLIVRDAMDYEYMDEDQAQIEIRQGELDLARVTDMPYATDVGTEAHDQRKLEQLTALLEDLRRAEDALIRGEAPELYE